MAEPTPIYASTPGLLISKNPAEIQVVLLPPASTIASQLIIRDISGTANSTYPIIVSTTNGALFIDGTSSFAIDTPYSFFSAAALKRDLYMPLYASSFQAATHYGTESNFTPQFQYISTAYNPASFNALSSTTLQGTLINGAPLFTITSPSFHFNPASLSTSHLSAPQLTVDALYTAGAIKTTSSYSEYLSIGRGIFSTVTTDSVTFTGSTTLQSTLRTAGSFQIGGNISIAGQTVFADISANDYWSTLGTIGIGSDVSGRTFTVGGSTIVGSAYASGSYFVSTASVTGTLSTILASASTAVYSGGLGVGLSPGSALSATVDISGSGSVTGALTATGISTFQLSTGSAVVSSATLLDINTPYNAFDLKVQGGQLYVSTTAFGGGGSGTAEFVGNSFTASNYLYTKSSITSTLTIGSTLVNLDFNMAVYGTAHSSSILGDNNRPSTLWVAVGNSARPDLGIGRAFSSSIKYSWNGSNNWSNAVIGGFSEGQDVAWNGRMWVAVGHVTTNNPVGTGNARSTIQWSLDGSNWSNCTLGGGFNGAAGGWGIAWNGKMWIASGHDIANSFKSTIQYSYDGSNFQAVPNAVNFLDGGATYSNVTFRPTWNGRMWIAGRSSAGAAASNACYSYDGLNWSNLTISTIVGPVSSTQWNGSYWLALGGAGNSAATNERSVALSSNGFNWISSIDTTFGQASDTGYYGGSHAHRALWNGSFWVGVGIALTTGIVYSFNGLNWIQSAGGNRNTSNAVFDNFQTGSGLTYYLPTTNYNHYGGGRGISWNGRLYVATGYYDTANTTPTPLVGQTIQYSTDGINWAPAGSSNGFNVGNYGVSSGANGNSVAWQSNCQTDISLPGQDIITSRTQQTYQSTAQIYSLSSLVTLNQTLFVDSARQTSINSYYSSISTQYLFHVNGSMLTYGASKQGGAATWTVVSDERVKQDIEVADLSACYHAVRGLHVHKYKFKDEYVDKLNLPSKPRYGLYAEEVEQVIPDAVMETNVLGQNIKMLDMEPVNMLHYGATSFLYSTLKHQTSSITGKHTYITAAGPLQDISGAIHSNPTYRNISSLQLSLTELFNAHNSNYQ